MFEDYIGKVEKTRLKGALSEVLAAAFGNAPADIEQAGEQLSYE